MLCSAFKFFFYASSAEEFLEHELGSLTDSMIETG
jgi:hypothetical protein